MRRHLLGIVGGALIVALAAAPSALARAGDRTFDQTYPVASTLCVKAHANTLPPKLAPHDAAVITACDTLENGFQPLVATVDEAESTYLGVVSAQHAAVATACQKPVTNHAACISARETAKTTIATARATEVSAVATFHASVETNRSTFWATIATLRSSS
jgi:hypothetical protein